MLVAYYSVCLCVEVIVLVWLLLMMNFLSVAVSVYVIHRFFLRVLPVYVLYVCICMCA